MVPTPRTQQLYFQPTIVAAQSSQKPRILFTDAADGVGRPE
jgi:hypothetical protein